MRHDARVDRTDRMLKLAIRLVILPGLAAASYLTYAKLTDTTIVCGHGGGCNAVNTSEWSEVAGIPVTLIGMVTYILMMISTFIKADIGKTIGAFLAVTGAAFSVFLQYQALVVMELTCQWCLTSAVAMLLLAVLTLWRLLRLPSDLDHGDSAIGLAEDPQ